MVGPINSTERRKLLLEVVNNERKMDCDVVARIALDEIAELDIQITPIVKLSQKGNKNAS